MNIKPLTFSLLALGIAQGNAAIIWGLGDSATPGRGITEPAELYGTGFTVNFRQETGINPLAGNSNSPDADLQVDDDYYFAGVYTNQVDGGPAYTTAGVVGTNEVAVERAITSGDNNLRYHFNLDAGTQGTDLATLTFAFLNVDDNGTNTGIFNIDAFFNGVQIGSFVHSAATDSVAFTTAPIAISAVNGTGGAPDDNYVELRSNVGGSTARWSNMDYIQLDVSPVPEPSSSLYLLGLAGLGFCYRRRSK